MKFNPEDHMLSLRGNKYLQVMWRLVWFREEHPDWTIQTKVIGQANGFCMFKASIVDDKGRVLSTGHGSETKEDFGDYIEKAETKAVGRALAMLGYGTQFSPDLDEGARIVDSPVPPTAQDLIDRFTNGCKKCAEKTKMSYEDVIFEVLEGTNLPEAGIESWDLEQAKQGFALLTKFYKEVVDA